MKTELTTKQPTSSLSDEQIVYAFCDLDVSSIVQGEEGGLVYPKPHRLVTDPDELIRRFLTIADVAEANAFVSLTAHYRSSIKSLQDIMTLIGSTGDWSHRPDHNGFESSADVRRLTNAQLNIVMSQLDLRKLTIDPENHNEVRSTDEADNWVINDWFNRGSHYLCRLFMNAMISADGADAAYAQYKQYIIRVYNAESAFM